MKDLLGATARPRHYRCRRGRFREAPRHRAADDLRDRLQSQADRIGLAALTRCTELVAAGLTELKGPTAPRLQLELVCAKLLLPGAHGDELSLAARFERMERRLAIAGAATTSR